MLFAKAVFPGGSYARGLRTSIIVIPTPKAEERGRCAPGMSTIYRVKIPKDEGSSSP